jgi:hypothetical protein
MDMHPCLTCHIKYDSIGEAIRCEDRHAPRILTDEQIRQQADLDAIYEADAFLTAQQLKAQRAHEHETITFRDLVSTVSTTAPELATAEQPRAWSMPTRWIQRAFHRR